MKWLRHKLFLIFISAIFGGGPAFFASSASGADITTDPLVLQQTDRANWEPGGSYFPGNFWDRGSIIARGGNVTTSLTSSTNVGGWSLQNATISGQYTYTNDLTSYHPYTVHSPFNFTNSASDSVSTSGNGRQVTVDMSWDGTMVHPANGYDGSQGGGYPAPVGAIDLFTFDITGTATGAYLIPAQEQQQTENSNERFNPLTDLTVPTNIDTSPRVGGSPNSGSGVTQNNQTGQSSVGLTIQQNRNPTGYRQTEQQRLGGGGSGPIQQDSLVSMHWILDKVQKHTPDMFAPDSAKLEATGGVGFGTKGEADFHLDIITSGIKLDKDENGQPRETTYAKVGGHFGGTLGPASGSIGIDLFAEEKHVSENKVVIGEYFGPDISGKVKVGIPYVVGSVGPGTGFEARFQIGSEIEMTPEKYSQLTPIQEGLMDVPLLGKWLVSVGDSEIDFQFAREGEFKTTKDISADVGGYYVLGGGLTGSFEQEQVWRSWK